MSNPLSTQGLAVDPSSLNALRYGTTGKDDKAALKEAAKQFESLFMRELIKSMREATSKSGLMDGEGSDLGKDLLDRQIQGDADSTQPVWSAPAASNSPASTVSQAPAGSRQAGFVDQHEQAAETVARESGIPASYMIGQAGHETGWGRSEIRHADGSPSFNLFGIKATGGWKGKVAEITTTEYVDGEPRKTVAKFRAYDSYADSFRDYARLVSQNPRYDQAMDQIGSVQGYAAGLQKGGYATDPQYAAKLSRAINTTLNLQRAQS
jgi:peptidoglycan hydrolase FlgJ